LWNLNKDYGEGEITKTSQIVKEQRQEKPIYFEFRSRQIYAAKVKGKTKADTKKNCLTKAIRGNIKCTSSFHLSYATTSTKDYLKKSTNSLFKDKKVSHHLAERGKNEGELLFVCGLRARGARATTSNQLFLFPASANIRIFFSLNSSLILENTSLGKESLG
jgi:hypothetical protein